MSTDENPVETPTEDILDDHTDDEDYDLTDVEIVEEAEGMVDDE